MSRLRVALAHPFSWPEVRRGAERYLHDLADWLAGAGHDVHVVTSTGERPSSSVSWNARPGIAMRRLRRIEHPRLDRRSITAVETFGLTAWPHLVRRRYDVVHALTPTAALAGRLSGQRTVFTLLGHPTRNHFDRNTIERRLTRAAIHGAVAVVALSRASADAAQGVFGHPVDVLPPGVWLDRFPPDLTPRSGPPRILFSADASDRRKGLDRALAAFGRVLDRHPDARMWLSGPGDPTWALAEIGDGGRVERAIDVLGPGELEDVPLRYREATLTVLPSHSEAFGLALVESLASGTPVVCTTSGGMPEIVDHPSVGRTAAHGDVDALARSIDEVIQLAADGRTMATCADHARRWGWKERVGPMHEELYHSIVRRPRRSRSSAP